MRVELTTSALQVRRSDQLSYSGDSHTGTRTRVGWVKTSYPNHLDYVGLVVAVGFEPTKHNALDLESNPFDQAREHYLYYGNKQTYKVSNFQKYIQ